MCAVSVNWPDGVVGQRDLALQARIEQVVPRRHLVDLGGVVGDADGPERPGHAGPGAVLVDPLVARVGRPELVQPGQVRDLLVVDRTEDLELRIEGLVALVVRREVEALGVVARLQLGLDVVVVADVAGVELDVVLLQPGLGALDRRVVPLPRVVVERAARRGNARRAGARARRGRSLGIVAPARGQDRRCDPDRRDRETGPLQEVTPREADRCCSLPHAGAPPRSSFDDPVACRCG